MSATSLRVRVLPGDAVVARSGSGVIVIEAADERAWPLAGAMIRVVHEVCGEAEPAAGDTLVREIAALASSRPAGELPAFAAVAPGSTGLAAVLSPGMELVFTDANGPQLRSGREAEPWLECVVPEDAEQVVVGCEPVGTVVPAGFGQLITGVVPGAGVVLRFEAARVATDVDTGETELPAPAVAVPATPAAASAVETVDPAQVRASLPQGTGAPAGLLVFDDGSAYLLDTDFVIGREPEADAKVASGVSRPLVLEDDGRSVSRVHVEVSLRGGEVVVTDRGSTNGTFVRVPPSEEWVQLGDGESASVTPGSQVVIGQRTFVYELQP